VGGDVAYGHCIQHATMTDKSGRKVAMTVRITGGYRKINGQWLIAHEHVSIPVDLATMRPVMDSK
jgi:ketosteroid isomerase-like protein